MLTDCGSPTGQVSAFGRYGWPGWADLIVKVNGRVLPCLLAVSWDWGRRGAGKRQKRAKRLARGRRRG